MKSAVCLAGAGVSGRGAVALEHRAGLPAGQAHQIRLATALGEPLGGEGVAELVGYSPGKPAWSPPGRAGAGELAVRRNLGDAGAPLDATAKAAYQARLAELGAELEEAERGNGPARATRARAERDFLVAELARAVGLGGRDRLNMTRAIRAAMANLARVHRSLWRQLAATVRTCRYCSYAPDPRTPRLPGSADPGVHRRAAGERIRA